APVGSFGTSAPVDVAPPHVGSLNMLVYPTAYPRSSAPGVLRVNSPASVAEWWVGDSGASAHGTSSRRHMYNTRPPTAAEQFLLIGNGASMEVVCMGWLDLLLLCDTTVRVTLTNEFDILLNKHGAYI
ncbi:unnamed protein product, partial [Ectocarpus sp. 12 AP-2014]